MKMCMQFNVMPWTPAHLEIGVCVAAIEHNTEEYVGNNTDLQSRDMVICRCRELRKRIREGEGEGERERELEREREN